MEKIHCFLALLIVLSPIHNASSLLDVSALPNHIGRGMREHHGTDRWKDSYPIHFSSSQKKASDTVVYASHYGKGYRSGKSSKKSSSSKSSKKSSGKGGYHSPPQQSGGGHTPTQPSHPVQPPHPSPTNRPTTPPPSSNRPVASSDDGGDRPPVGSPTRPPNTIECDVDSLLSSYAIEYTLEITAGDIPSPDDYRDLAVVVERYISEYLTSQFSGSNTVMMTGVTSITGDLNFQSPVVFAEYESRACFRRGSDVPSLQALDTARAGMLSTQQDQDLFISAIQTLLPTGNIFKSSLVGVEFENLPSASRLDGGSGSAAVLASAIAGCTMLAAGIFLYKRQRLPGGGYIADTKPTSKLDEGGGSTVAGETFTGESFATESIRSHATPPKVSPRIPPKLPRRAALLLQEVQRNSSMINKSEGVNLSPRASLMDSESPTSWSSVAISRETWKRELEEEPASAPSESRRIANSMSKYDAFLEDSDEDDCLKDPHLSIYAEDLEVAGESTEAQTDLDIESTPQYSMDEIEEMLSHPI
ncbi:unnamed protein product [Cylindrotheca closterium]|uniref:SEA domain-containing protein n=1 Tax=Cylindrotheca closterium TaxID=2856 RepID=A0AAD2FRR7_9STRA|nr:unnamed protein product [Cylindrotheca closterium]